MTTHKAFLGFITSPRDAPLEYALDFHLHENPSYPAFVHPDENGQMKYITYGETVPAIHRAGRIIMEAMNFNLAKGIRTVTPVVALLAQTDSLTYTTAVLGLLRAGITVFPISPRFSPDSIAHLLRTAQPHFLFVTHQTGALADEALSHLQKSSDRLPSILELPTYKEFFHGDSLFESLPEHHREMDEIALINHSSGSSARFPKVIHWTPAFIRYGAERIEYDDQKSTGEIFALPALELFHTIGLLSVFWMTRIGYIIGLLNPADPGAVFPANMNLMFKTIELIKPTFIYLSARIVELWAEDPYKVEVLKSRIVGTAGRFVNKSIGDSLVKQGVTLTTMFGSTESSAIANFTLQKPEEWEYFTVHPRIEVRFISRPDGLSEMMVLLTEQNSLPICNTILDGQPCYNLGDLFLPHPTKPNTYRMFGRISDQIMLATGDMVNPIPAEEAIRQHPSVLSAVIFGHTRSTLGVVIEPEVEHAFESTNSPAREQFIAGLWPVIEKSNQDSPAYARISKQMIIVASKDRPFSYSLKGLPKRPTVWLEYQEEIDLLYRAELGNISTSPCGTARR